MLFTQYECQTKAYKLLLKKTGGPKRNNNDMKPIPNWEARQYPMSLEIQYNHLYPNISYRLSNNSEAFASELLENL